MLNADQLDGKAAMDLFKEVMVWKRLGDTSAVRYCCLNDLKTDQYAVQSADFFRLPLEEQQFRNFQSQFAELFIEVSVHERCDWYDSLEDAIRAHDRDFS
ncbi:hypothetical protein [Paraherbaspirillum soli]|uniref:Uncharacterized protein n=1 Tax=Paraherbaspirillum soli TaxID=631222 RepID=A0ABW0MA46_9BURK